MRGLIRLFHPLLLLTLTLTLTIVAMPVRAQDCGRICLEGFMNQFLDALLAHDASALPTGMRFAGQLAYMASIPYKSKSGWDEQ